MPVIIRRNKILNAQKDFKESPELKNDVESDGALDTTREKAEEGARQGDMIAQNLLGFMYYTGFKVPRNEKEAVRLFRASASQDYLPSLNMMKVMLNEGDIDTRFHVIYHLSLLTKNPHLIKRFNLWAKHYPKKLIAILQENPEDTYEAIEKLLNADNRNFVYALLQDYVMRFFLKLEGVFDTNNSKLILEYLFENEILIYMQELLIPLPEEKIHINMLPGLWNTGVASRDALIIRKLNIEANNGDDEAQFRLGNYFRNIPVKLRDLKESYEWYRASACNGNARAQFELGRCYEEKRGVAHNLERAAYYYGLAAEQQYEAAQNRLTQLFDGNVTVISLAIIFRAALSVKKPSMCLALFDLAVKHPVEFIILLYESPEGTYEKLKALSTEKFNEKIDRLLLEFLTRILTILEMKLDQHSLKHVLTFLLPPSLTQKVFQILKPNFINPAMPYDAYALSRQYLTDENVTPSDYLLGHRLMHNEASRGNVQAQIFLGYHYEKYSLMADPVRGFYWFACAAKQENVEAQIGLSRCYDTGRGVEKNKDKAFYWCERAAKKGSPIAQCMLGGLYEEGYIHFPDFKEAVYWFLLAAEQKFEPAIEKLMRLYDNSYGENKYFLIYHAAIILQKKEMLDDLNLFAKEHPKKFIAFLEESPPNAFEKMKPYLAPTTIEVVDRLLKDPSYQEPPEPHRLYSFFNRCWEMLPTLKSTVLPNARM
jgi:TPR repeat protein